VNVGDAGGCVTGWLPWILRSRSAAPVAKSFALPPAELATLPHRELTDDFHCVAGWSATSLHWEGVAFETFYRVIIPAIAFVCARGSRRSRTPPAPP